MTRLASGSAISRCRLHATSTVVPGQRVLVVGAGHGEDVVAAIAAGGIVTVVELSATMLAHLRARVGDRPVRLIHGDAFDHDEVYDIVIANFFLNVFGGDDETRMRRHLVDRVGVGGRLVIGDFAVVTGGLLRVVALAHWYLALAVFRVLSGNAVHPQSDHARLVVDDGLRLIGDRRFRVLGLPLYASLTFERARA